MKITKSYLKQIIKEEIQKLTEVSEEPASEAPDTSKAKSGPLAIHEGSPPPRFLGMEKGPSGNEYFILHTWMWKCTTTVSNHI